MAHGLREFLKKPWSGGPHRPTLEARGVRESLCKTVTTCAHSRAPYLPVRNSGFSTRCSPALGAAEPEPRPTQGERSVGYRLTS